MYVGRPPCVRGRPALEIFPGGDLLSRRPASRVPSALEDLTSVFGMGTGVAPPLYPPESAEVGSKSLEVRQKEQAVSSPFFLLQPNLFKEQYFALFLQNCIVM